MPHSSEQFQNELTEEPTQKDFPGGPVVRSPPAIAGDMGSILGRQRFHKPQNATTEAHAP